MKISDKTLSIIGVSPRNHYYTDAENIKFSLEAVLQKQEAAYVMVPDIPDINNYLAYGYNADKARQKALNSTLKKAVREICAHNGYSCADNAHSLAQVRIINWEEDVEKSPLYQAKLADIKTLYLRDAYFHADIRETTAQSIHSRINNNSSTKKHIEKTGIDHAIDQAVNYILSELAFLEVAPKLFEGERAEYIYHRDWGVYEKFIQGAYSQTPMNLSFRILNRTAPQPV